MSRCARRDTIRLTRGSWDLDTLAKPGSVQLTGRMEFQSTSTSRELFLPRVTVHTRLLSAAATADLAVTATVAPLHEEGTGYGPLTDSSPRSDGFWSVHILKPGAVTPILVHISIRAPPGLEAATLKALKSAWVEVEYDVYGPDGLASRSQHVVVPLRDDVSRPAASPGGWASVPGEEGLEVLRIPTHLLTHADDPVSVAARYAGPHARPGDVLALAETPLAIMQGRWRHPGGVRTGWFAKVACRVFNPTSNMATAVGMQVLIDMVGRLRVAVALVVGIAARLLGRRGWFYKVAGAQSTLIDDLSGTLPPYDHFLVLGPTDTQETVDAIQRRTNMATCIVDVNDLTASTGRMRVLAATSEVDETRVRAALNSNPAGNSDQQTPLVLIRYTPQFTIGGIQQ